MKSYIYFYQWGGPFNAISRGETKAPEDIKQGARQVGKALAIPLLPLAALQSCSEGYCNPPSNPARPEPDHGQGSISSVPNYDSPARVKVLQNSVDWSGVDPSQMHMFVDTICNTYRGCKKVPYTHAAVYIPSEKIENKKAHDKWGRRTDDNFIRYIDPYNRDKGYYRYNPNKVDTLIGETRWRRGEDQFDPAINKTILSESYFE